MPHILFRLELLLAHSLFGPFQFILEENLSLVMLLLLMCELQMQLLRQVLDFPSLLLSVAP